MFIKKDLRKIPTILEDAVDCNAYDEAQEEDENGDGDEDYDDNGNNKTNNKSNITKSKVKRIKREEPLTVLRLGRRKQEFNGTVQVLCDITHVPKLKYLQTINLYECNINNLTGFGTMFSVCSPNLTTINLGRNPLSDGIPDELSKCQSLKHLWLDDCGLTGSLPNALLHLPNLESLRIPNNNITDLTIGGINTNTNTTNSSSSYTSTVIPLKKLKLLCLDRNKLGSGIVHGSGIDGTSTKEKDDNENSRVGKDKGTKGKPEGEGKDNSSATVTPTTSTCNSSVSGSGSGGGRFLPSNLAEWLPNLEELLVRHNSFTKLGITKWPSSLKILHVSSNQLEDLDEIMGITNMSSGIDVDDNMNMNSDMNSGVDDTPMMEDNPSLSSFTVSTSIVTSSALPSLTHLYANGNQLKNIPNGILTNHPKLQRLVVSHNAPLKQLPNEVWDQLGLLITSDEGGEKEKGEEKNDINDNNNKESAPSSTSPACVEIIWKPNPNLNPPGSINDDGDSDNNNNNDNSNDNDESMQE